MFHKEHLSGPDDDVITTPVVEVPELPFNNPPSYCRQGQFVCTAFQASREGFGIAKDSGYLSSFSSLQQRAHFELVPTLSRGSHRLVCCTLVLFDLLGNGLKNKSYFACIGGAPNISLPQWSWQPFFFFLLSISLPFSPMKGQLKNKKLSGSSFHVLSICCIQLETSEMWMCGMKLSKINRTQRVTALW